MKKDKIKKLIHLLFENAFFLQMFLYVLFYFCLWGIHLVLISLISYFHINLNHNIKTIGDWIIDRGWLIVLLTKFTLCYFVFQFLKLKNTQFLKLKNNAENAVLLPKFELIVGIIFYLLSYIVATSVQWNYSLIFSPFKIFLQMVGIGSFYFIDFILLSLLEIFYPLKSKFEFHLKIFTFSFLFYFLSNAVFKNEMLLTSTHFIFFLVMLFLGQFRRDNWTYPMFFLFIIILPISAFFGLDPIWSKTYSVFYSAEKNYSSVINANSIILIFYLKFKEYNKPEFVFRD